MKWRKDEVVTCVIDEEKVNRYSLTCTWDERLAEIVFVMVNPSTGNKEQCDQTLRKCVNFTRSWGYGSMTVVNLFSYITSDTKDLRIYNPSEQEVAQNKRHIKKVIKGAKKVIFAWGEAGAKHQVKTEEIIRLIPVERQFMIERATGGFPKHPLFLKAELKPIVFA